MTSNQLPSPLLENIVVVVKSVENDYRSYLIEQVERKRFEAQPGTTYGDTDFSNPSVVYGYNKALDDVLILLSKEVSHDEPRTD